MSEVMPRRRKINTRAGRRAARERVRELVSEHDDRVVLLIWGGRVLGWLLLRIAAARWTAATVQRICRRHGIPTDRPADPPGGFLTQVRRRVRRA